MLKIKLGILLVFSASFFFPQMSVDAQSRKKQEVKKLKVGDKAPDFNLETFGDKKVKLSERFGKEGHPVVLLFSRANW